MRKKAGRAAKPRKSKSTGPKGVLSKSERRLQILDAARDVFAKRGYAQVQAAAGCEAAWRSAVGEKFAPHTRPGNVKRGVLEVVVRNSATLQELAFMKVKIVKQLGELAPEHKIRDVRFRIGAVD